MTSLRRPAVLAGAFFATTMTLLCVQVYYVLASGAELLNPVQGLHTFPIVTLGTALGAGIGALVMMRQPGNRVGWLFCVGMLGTAIGLATKAYVVAVHVYGFAGPQWLLEPLMVVAIEFGSVWALTLIAVTFLVFPYGRLPSRRWRPVAVLLPVPLVITAVVLVVLAATGPLDITKDNDFGPAVVIPFLTAQLLLAVLIVIIACSLVRRLRRAEGVLRQQLRWLATSAVALAAAIALGGMSEFLPEASLLRQLGSAPLHLAFASVPVAAGVAVLRYRLYDIDVVINRGIVLGGLLVFVTVGYVGAVVSIGALLGEQVHGWFWPSWIATPAVALAFQPVRRRVERLADRLTYGRRAAPYEALADLTRRLEETPETDEVLPAIAEAAAVAVGARAATVRLHVPGGPDRIGTWPADAPDVSGETASVTVSDRGEKLGSIAVRPPPGVRLRERERRLLGDLATQSALALRNARLTSELHVRVADLDRTTAELAESRLRLISTRDIEQARLEAAIRRDVMQHLVGLPADIRRTADELAEALQHNRPLPPLHAQADATEAALAKLRVLTRGVFPTQLARSGLAPALAVHVSNLAGRSTFSADASVTRTRFNPRVEAALYFCVVEAARQLPAPVAVGLALHNDTVVATVRCTGMVPLDLAPLHDRINSVAGSLACTHLDGSTVVEVKVHRSGGLAAAPRAELPVRAAQLAGGG